MKLRSQKVLNENLKNRFSYRNIVMTSDFMISEPAKILVFQLF